MEVEGVRLDDGIRLAGTRLVLNGAGLRSLMLFKVYVIGIYTAQRQHNADAIFADPRPKRIEMHVVVEHAETARFLNGVRKGIAANRSAAELAALSDRMTAFEQMFGATTILKRGDVVTFDSLPGRGTRVAVNGAVLGRISGDDFYRALLAIWIGDKPANDDLKKELLGDRS